MNKPIDVRFKKGIELFNEGKFFESHEVIEDIWRETEGEYKDFYRGLIQAAAALHHLKRGTLKGGILVYRSSIEHLKNYPPVTLGLNVRKLIEDIQACFKPLIEAQDKVDLKNLPIPHIEFRDGSR